MKYLGKIYIFKSEPNQIIEEIDLIKSTVKGRVFELYQEMLIKINEYIENYGDLINPFHKDYKNAGFAADQFNFFYRFDIYQKMDFNDCMFLYRVLISRDTKYFNQPLNAYKELSKHIQDELKKMKNRIK